MTNKNLILAAADITKCLNSTLNNYSQNAVCTNTTGNYYCNCTNRFSGDGSRDGIGCKSITKHNLLLVASISQCYVLSTQLYNFYYAIPLKAFKVYSYMMTKEDI